MTLDDAIIHAEEVAFENETKAKEYREDQERKCALIPFATMDFTKEYSCINCAKEHRQLAEWLKDYKRLKSAIEDIKADINLLSDSEQIDLHTVEITNWIGMRNKVLDIINKHIEG